MPNAWPIAGCEMGQPRHLRIPFRDMDRRAGTLNYDVYAFIASLIVQRQLWFANILEILGQRRAISNALRQGNTRFGNVARLGRFMSRRLGPARWWPYALFAWVELTL